MRRAFFLLYFVSLLGNISFAQTGGLKGTIFVDSTKEIISGAIVTLYRGSEVVARDTSNENGEYAFANMMPGATDCLYVRYSSFKPVFVRDIIISPDRTTRWHVGLKKDTEGSSEPEVKFYEIPMVSTGGGSFIYNNRGCPYKTRYNKTGKCPNCKSRRNVIPVYYGMPSMGPFNDPDYKAPQPFVDFYPGGCVLTVCHAKYYCKKHDLLF